MKYKIISLFVIIATLTSTGTFCQDTDSQTDSIVLKQDYRKKFSGAILFGKGVYLSELIPLKSPLSSSWSVPGYAPQATGISFQNDVTNMFGAEFRYSLTERWALKLSGGAILRNTPSQENLPGIIDSESSSATWIPDYEAVEDNSTTDVNINIGTEYHFMTMSKFSPYIGFVVPFCYSRISQYDPTINVDNISGDIIIADIGHRHVEAVGFGCQAVFGGDYALSDCLYLGLEIKPISYLYAFNIKTPAPGLESRSADTHTIGFFTQPMFKLGFKF